MEKSAGKRLEFAGFDPQRCGDFLRRQHPHKTAAEVAARTGVPAKTVERWLAGTAPSAGAVFRLIAIYGPAFLAATIPGLGWVERAAAIATHEGLAREIEALRCRQEIVARELRGGS